MLRLSFLIIAFALSINLGVAQQLPPAPDAIPQLRRGANGEIETIPAPPPKAPSAAAAPRASDTAKPAAKAAAPRVLAKPRPREAAPPRAPVAAAPAPVAPAAPVAAAREPRAEPTAITLPEPLAIELPAGKTELAPDAAPLRDLLEAAKSGDRAVTNDLSHPVGPEPVRVTWIAWSGAPRTSKPAATASAVLIVLPPGTMPVGLSGDENATGGNNATKIARNAAGDVVHMVWLDGGRPGKSSAVMYRRAAVAPNGTVRLDDPVRVDDAASTAWNAYPALAVVGNTVHVAWQSNGHVWYRRLADDDGAFRWGPIQDVGARSEGADIGPSMSASGDLIHIATPSGIDAVSTDDGTTWRSAKIPIPAGTSVKTISVAVDAAGRAHFAFSDTVRGPDHASTEKASRGYWELRYIRRDADGAWVDAQNILRGRTEWAEPSNDDDVLADWARLLVDDDNNLHVTWHGTAMSRIYGNDSAFYARRAAEGTSWRAELGRTATARAGGPSGRGPPLLRALARAGAGRRGRRAVLRGL